METIMTYKYDDVIVDIIQDFEPIDPRTWDNLGTMICGHPRHVLGDEQFSRGEYANAYELRKHLFKDRDALIALPLYLLDHSMLSMSTEPFGGYIGRFDSSMIGYIYVSKEKIREEYGKKRISKKLRESVTEYLKGEIETYNQWLQNDVYGYSKYRLKICECCGTVLKKDIDSCWGFYGFDFENNGLWEYADINESWIEVIE
jgi:hypothetical protein